MLLLLSLAALAAPPPYEQPVQYADQHDPSVISLEDGRRLQVRYDGLSFDAVDAWSAGRPLVLTYFADRGMTLLDPASGAKLTVHTVDGGPHQLDVWTDACMDNAMSTLSMHDCLKQGILNWSVEVDRLWAALATAAPGTQAAQATWIAHRDAEFDAISTTYGAMQGSMWGISAGQARLRVVRDQALRLSQLLADTDIGS